MKGLIKISKISPTHPNGKSEKTLYSVALSDLARVGNFALV